MAAPCGGVVGRPLYQFVVSCLTKNTLRNTTWVRQCFVPSRCRTTLQTQHVTERVDSPWTLMAAVCLQRLPVISADCDPLEQRFKHTMQQMELVQGILSQAAIDFRLLKDIQPIVLRIELEKSLYSEHELRLLEDAERMRRRQTDNYDSDEEDDNRGHDIVLAQDVEDSWEQKLKNFQPSPRVEADVDKDLTSVERCLADSLVLLAEQQVGNEKLWLLPQAEWQTEETLRQTAERALTSLPAGFNATFLSNAPCGVYKYKLPKAARTVSAVGTKVFFFKAILSDVSPPTAPNAPLMWLKKSELHHFVKPAYMMKVNNFILDP